MKLARSSRRDRFVGLILALFLANFLPGAVVTAASAVRGNNYHRQLQDGDDDTNSENTAPSKPVKVEVWTKPSLDWDKETGEEDGPNVKFMKMLKEVKVGMGEAIDFDMNSYIGSKDEVCKDLQDAEGNPLGPAEKKQVCDDSCANSGRYCEAPPMDSKHYGVTKGSDLMGEALRRQCIWSLQHKRDDWEGTRKYFDYVENMGKVECDTHGYQKICINNVLQQVHVGGNPVRDCMDRSGGIDGNQNNRIFDSLVQKQKNSNIDTLPAVLVNGVIMPKDVAIDDLLRAICKAAPDDIRPDDVCSNIEEAVGEDEDPDEGKEAEEELVNEIAEELGETPEDVKGENAAELEDKLEKEEEENGEVDPEDEEKLAEELGTQDETELNGDDDEEMGDVDEISMAEDEAALEKVEAKDAGVETEDHNGEIQPIIEVWTSPLLDWDQESLGDDGPNIDLFERLRDIIVGFGHSVKFRPQPYVFSKKQICTRDEDHNLMTEEAANDCADTNCANGQRYCGYGPDDWSATGQSLVKEGLRRVCIWEEYGRGDEGDGASVYFEYLKKFHHRKCDQEDDPEPCVEQVYNKVGIEANKVNMCITNSGGLERDRENAILEPLVQVQKQTFHFFKLSPMDMPFIFVDGNPMRSGANFTVEELSNFLCAKFEPDSTPDYCSEENPTEDEESNGDDDAANESEGEEAPESAAPSQAPSLPPSEAPSQAPSQAPTKEKGDGEPTATEPESEESEPTEETESGESTTTELEEESSNDDNENPEAITLETPAAQEWGLKSKSDPTDEKSDKDLDFDTAVVNSALDSLGVLNKCDVDTSAVISKVVALSKGNLKQETESIQSELPVLMSENCPHEEGEEILQRMEDFHRCAKFNLQELIETFPSTATGVAMRCANAYSKMTKEEEESGFIPEACIRTLEADSVLGRGIFGLYLYPDVACPCFEKLGNKIPECTADVWPIPINGALIKAQSCLVGQYCQTIDGLCEDNLKILNECLPPFETSSKEIAASCPAYFEKCAALYDNVPPMLNAAPLPDSCVRVAQGSKFFGQHVVERYDAFRHQCGQNLELWEGHTPVAEFKAFVQQGILGIDYTSVPFVSGASAGFVAGIIFTIAVIVVRCILICVCSCLRRWLCCCCRRKKQERPTTKDYSTVDTEVEDSIADTEEYHD